MAEEHQNKSPEYETTSPVADEAVETKDRGFFDFLGKKKEEDTSKKDEDVLAEDFNQQVHVSEPHKADHVPEPYKAEHHEPEPYKAGHHEPEPYQGDHHVTEPYKADHHVPEPEHKEEEKKPSLLEKLHRSGSSSSSSSSDEEEGVEKKKKKKGLKEKITGKSEEDTNVPIEKYDDASAVPTEEKKGFLEKIKEKLPHKKTEETAVAPPPTVVDPPVEEKKGFMDKIKEKLPGYHAKTGGEEEKEVKY